MLLFNFLFFILIVATIGFIVYLIVTYIPMPPPFAQVIIALTCIAIVVYFLLMITGQVPSFKLR